MGFERINFDDVEKGDDSKSLDEKGIEDVGGETEEAKRTSPEASDNRKDFVYEDRVKERFEKIMEERGREEAEKREKEDIPGRFLKWFPDRGFGFIKTPEGSAFCHINDLCVHLSPEDRNGQVDFKQNLHIARVIKKEKGLAVENVRCDKCVAPSKWELVKEDEEAFGIHKFNAKQVAGATSSFGPSYQDLLEINKEFYEAKKESDAFYGTRIDSSEGFFKKFGEPQSIRVKGNDIVLVYSQGEREVSIYEAINSKHWEVSSSGQYRNNGEYLEVEFVFPDIPEAKAWISVARLSSNPFLGKEFDLLPKDDQDKILAMAKEKMLSPEIIAEDDFNEFANNSYDSVSDLHNSIRSLQLPGEVYISHNTEKGQLYEPLSSDERRGNFYYNGSITTNYLTVGARKRERPEWWNDGYAGGVKFIISEGEYAHMPDGSAEEIRNDLLGKYRKRFQDKFENVRKTPPPDDRIYTLGQEKWRESYEKRWEELRKALEEKWKIEDESFLEKAKGEQDKYNEVANNLLSARQETEQAARLAYVSHIGLDKYPKPEYGNIGADTINKMQEEAAALRTYASEVNKYIPDAIKAREQEFQNEQAVKEEEERQRKAQEESEIKQFGVSGRLLEIARDLAGEAEKKLGRAGASSLFNSALSVPYGRQRVQNDIYNALGDDISYEAKIFYGLSRARDVDAVLQATSRILESVDDEKKEEIINSTDEEKIEDQISVEEGLKNAGFSVKKKGK